MSDINPVFEAAMAPFTTHMPKERMAHCSCGRKEPSSRRADLFGFQDMGEGSKSATDTCTCGFTHDAHKRLYTSPKPYRLCKTFTARGAWDYDIYYCGCRGWD